MMPGVGLILRTYSTNVLRAQSKKGLPFGNPFFYMAEAQRFELWEGFPSPVFKTEEISLFIIKLCFLHGIFKEFQHPENQ